MCKTLTSLDLSDNQDKDNVKLIGRLGIEKLVEIVPYSNLVDVFIDPHPSALFSEEVKEHKEAASEIGSKKKKKRRRRARTRTRPPRLYPCASHLHSIVSRKHSKTISREKRLIAHCANSAKVPSTSLSSTQAVLVTLAQKVAAALMSDDGIASPSLCHRYLCTLRLCRFASHYYSCQGQSH